jgi:hypothetical protein
MAKDKRIALFERECFKVSMAGLMCPEANRQLSVCRVNETVCSPVEITLTCDQQWCCREIFSYSDDKACVGQQKHGGFVVRIARHHARITYPFDAIGIPHWFHVR